MHIKSDPESEVLDLYRKMEANYDTTSLPNKGQLLMWQHEMGVQTLTNLMYHIVNSKTPQGEQVIRTPMGFIKRTINDGSLELYSPSSYQRKKKSTNDHVPIWMTELKDRASAGGMVSKSVDEDLTPEYLEGKEVLPKDIKWLFSASHIELYRQNPSRLTWLYRAGTKVRSLKSLQRYYPKVFGKYKSDDNNDHMGAKEWISTNIDINLELGDSF